MRKKKVSNTSEVDKLIPVNAENKQRTHYTLNY